MQAYAYITLSFIILFLLLFIFVHKVYKQYDAMDKEQRVWTNTIFLGLSILFIIAYPITLFISISETINDLINRLRLLLQIIPIIMGACAIIIAYLNFTRKSFNIDKDGIGNLSYMSGIEHHNSNHSFTVINLKDKPIIIFNLVIKLHNISIRLPYKYPLIINGYGAERVDIPHINRFISHSNEGYFDVVTNEKYENHQSNRCSGNQIVKALAYEYFTVYAETNIRQSPIRLTKQVCDDIPESDINIEEIDVINELDTIDEEDKRGHYVALKQLPLSRSGNQFKL